MARRRDSPLIIEIDTSGPDAGAGGDAAVDAPEPPAPSWFATRVAEPARRRWSAVSRRTRVGVVAGTVVVAVLGAGTAVALDHRADAAHAAHMATQPGGVADLSGPLQESWRVEIEGGVLALLDGGLVVARDGTDVLAVDAATGEIAWRHDLGEWLECGTGNGWYYPAMRPTDRVVCLSGQPERTATVIAADGEVLGQRDLGEVTSVLDYTSTSTEVASIMGDGALAIGDRKQVELTASDVDDAIEQLDAMRADGAWQPTSVRVEDALTGEVRGESTLDLVTAEQMTECFASSFSDGTLWLHSEPAAQSDGVSLDLCGQHVTLGTDGTELGVQSRMPFRDGYLETDDDGTTRYVAADGTATVYDGWPVEPGATDGRDDAIFAWSDMGEPALSAFVGDERLWTARAPLSEILVGAAGTLVMSDGGDVVTGLDAATGETRWTREQVFGDSLAGYQAILGGSLTDGTLGLVARASPSDRSQLVALDLADGRTRWTLDTGISDARVLAVEGHVVIVEHGNSGWSVESDGSGIEFLRGALVGYATP